VADFVCVGMRTPQCPCRRSHSSHEKTAKRYVSGHSAGFHLGKEKDLHRKLDVRIYALHTP
jgi:hypothetical protein